jgi:SAM-dependent methyltransferase
MKATPSDDWLEPWLPELAAAARSLPVLELGCDTGRDTLWLVNHGMRVVATDISQESVHACAALVPAAHCLRHDLARPMPFREGAFGAVIASLCLHYFDWTTTVAAVSEIRRCLAPAGLLLCRLNSVRDHLHGAGAGEEIEPRFYRQQARYARFKRFFDSGDLDRLFNERDWRQLSRREVTIHRYAEPKVAWELALGPRR